MESNISLVEEVLKLYKEHSMMEVARMMNIEYDRVRRIIVKYYKPIEMKGDEV